jgi:hypothetical protein
MHRPLSTLALAGVATILLLLLGGFTAPAVAQGSVSALHVTWNAPEGCPSGEAVVLDVQRILGGGTSRRAEARADVTRLGPQHWAVHLVTTVDGNPGERSLDADSCGSLASATALILAWTIDPGRARTSPFSAPNEPSASTPWPPAPESFAPRNPTRVRVLLAAGGVGDLGMLPGVGTAAEVTVGVLVGRIRVEAYGSDWLRQDATRAAEGSHLQLLEGALRACYRGQLGRVIELDPCAGGGLDYLASNGFGESMTLQRSGTWGIVRGDLLLVWTLVGPLALRASLGLAVPLARPPVVIIDPQGNDITLHQAAPVTGRAGLGLEVGFP